MHRNALWTAILRHRVNYCDQVRYCEMLQGDMGGLSRLLWVQCYCRWLLYRPSLGVLTSKVGQPTVTRIRISHVVMLSTLVTVTHCFCTLTVIIIPSLQSLYVKGIRSNTGRKITLCEFMCFELIQTWREHKREFRVFYSPLLLIIFAPAFLWYAYLCVQGVEGVSDLLS